MEGYRLCLFGGFRLFLPNGKPAPITMRKAKGLIAILASSSGQSLGRAKLQDALWPDSSLPMQQASLRQALAHIRKTVTPDFVVSTREGCRIGPNVRLSCDYGDLSTSNDSVARDSNSVFLPEFHEPWFVRQRNTLASAHGETFDEALPIGTSLTDGLLALMRWYLSTKPSKALEMLRDHADIVVGIAPNVLVPILDEGLKGTSRTNPVFGWGLFWKGICTSSSQSITVGSHYFRSAQQYGIDHKDRELQIRATCSLSAVQGLSGKLEPASRQLLHLDGVVKPGAPSYGIYTSTLGVVSMHKGCISDGLGYVEQAHESIGCSALEAHRYQALKAVYLSTSGRDNEATDLLVVSEKFARESGNVIVSCLVQLSKGQVLLNQGSPAVAAGVFRSLAKLASISGNGHFELYARESLALASWRIRDMESVRSEMKTAKRIRAALGLGFTPWDCDRLGELAQQPN